MQADYATGGLRRRMAGLPEDTRLIPVHHYWFWENIQGWGYLYGDGWTHYNKQYGRHEYLPYQDWPEDWPGKA